MKKTITVKVPATTANLGSGFDSFGAALQLRNTLTVEVGGNPSGYSGHSASPEIIIRGEGAGALPTNASNLVWRAMRRGFAAASLKKIPRVRIVMENAVPLTSGLGSSASAVVGGLLAANEICYNKLSHEKLIQIAVGLEGHPDNAVPAFAGGFCVSFDDKGRTGYAKMSISRLGIVAAVCVPDVDFPTAAARGLLPRSVKMSDAVYNLSRSALFVAAVSLRDGSLIKHAVGDRLHQARRMKRIPGADSAFEAADKAGALGVCVSGAGPSIVALCPTGAARAATRAMSASFARKGINSRAFILDFTDRGATVTTKNK
ncbi:MAG: homoserine kinase [Elusimicrobia bacterium HGW-Elusimicrobia-1]|jgi:homoserine kinase|nr:MAG: homoserine kinase [Elusimicrobia bacterium HGW-Elusimicrobia-1]